MREWWAAMWPSRAEWRCIASVAAVVLAWSIVQGAGAWALLAWSGYDVRAEHPLLYSLADTPVLVWAVGRYLTLVDGGAAGGDRT